MKKTLYYLMAWICCAPARAGDDLESSLLRRFHSENQARVESLKREINETLSKSGLLEETRPEEAAALLRDALQRVHGDAFLGAIDRRNLVFALKNRLTEVVESHLLNIPRGLKDNIREPQPPPGATSQEREIASALQTAPQAVPATLLFYEGTQHAALLRLVSHEIVRVTINGQGLRYPASQIPGILVEKGLYVYHYPLHAYVFLNTDEALAFTSTEEPVLDALWKRLAPAIPKTLEIPESEAPGRLKDVRLRQFELPLDRLFAEEPPEIQRLARQLICRYADQKLISTKLDEADLQRDISTQIRRAEPQMREDRITVLTQRIIEQIRKQWALRPI